MIYHAYLDMWLIMAKKLSAENRFYTYAVNNLSMFSDIHRTHPKFNNATLLAKHNSVRYLEFFQAVRYSFIHFIKTYI